jgi:hypothetical protein
MGIFSWASGYSIPDFSDSNWSTALFLTPSGIIENFVRDNAIKTFYFDPSRGQGNLSMPRALAMGIVFALVCGNARSLFKGLKK